MSACRDEAALLYALQLSGDAPGDGYIAIGPASEAQVGCG